MVSVVCQIIKGFPSLHSPEKTCNQARSCEGHEAYNGLAKEVPKQNKTSSVCLRIEETNWKAEGRDLANGLWLLLPGPHSMEILQPVTGGKCKEVLGKVLHSLVMGEMF